MVKGMNNKGYMLIEIIVASVIAFSIAYYLLNLTYKFKNMMEDVYYSKELINDKVNITKNIMNMAYEWDIERFECLDSSSAIITLEDKNIKTLSIIDNNKTISIADYKKTLGDTVSFGKMECDGDNRTVIIPIKSMYAKDDYRIKLYFSSKKLDT